MANPIEDPERARRLARAIASDIALYHSAKLAANEDLTEEVNEGRRLFATRTVASLEPLFDEAVHQICKSATGVPAVYRKLSPGETVEHESTRAAERANPYTHPPVPERAPRINLVPLVAMLVVVAALAAWVATH